MNKEKLILILSGQDPQGAIYGICRQIETLFHYAAKKTLFIDLSDPNFTHQLTDAIARYEIEFAFSYLGLGAELNWQIEGHSHPVNLWEYHNIPFLKLQGDLPSYFIKKHEPLPKNAVNVYCSLEFSQVQEWYFADNKSCNIINPPIIFDQQPVDNIDFKKREQGTLVFLKNGNDPNQLLNLWHTHLPPSVTEDLCNIADSLLPPLMRCEPVNIFAYIVHYVSEKMGDASACRDIVRLYSAQLDDYFRRIKATMIATSLKKFPVKIIGRNWEHVNDGNSVAQFSNDLNFTQHGKTIFEESLGLIDMTANVDLNVHDRFSRAAGNYAYILTNQTSWMQENIPDYDQYTYTFNPEAFESKVDFLLKNKMLVVEQGKRLGEIVNAKIDNQDFVKQLLATAEKIKFCHQSQKPQLQDYFVW
ncbi:MAG: hypothetical protein ACMZ63_06910 [Methylotenera sp.]